MTYEARIRRIGWFAALAICTALYLTLHLKVHSVHSEVVQAERRIVALEEQNLLLETEFLTRSSQLQLARWNRVDIGYSAPTAEQFIDGERQLAMLGALPVPGAEATIQLAGNSLAEEADPNPRLVSPLTGEPLDKALLAREDSGGELAPRLAMVMQEGPTRIQLSAVPGGSVR